MEKKTKILLVDDEPAFTRLLKLNLETNGPYEVQVENDGGRAVMVAKNFRPDVIFLDVIMPDMDGGEVAARLRAEASLRQVPIVFLTAVVSKNEVIQHADVIGGQTFLAKPVSFDDVKRTIERLAA